MPCPRFDPMRCPDCPGDAALVPPDLGPDSDGKVMFIGEAPGENEDAEGRPFIGKAGKETNEGYLPLAGLTRDQVYFSNVVKCRPYNNQTPSDKLIKTCSDWHLKSEIKTYKPHTVVLLGASPCSLVPGIDLNIYHGVPRYAELYGHKCKVIPMWHPASGMHDTKQMIPLREDFRFLKEVLRYGKGWLKDAYPEPDYQLVRNRGDLKDYICGCDWDMPMALDTEFSHIHNVKTPYCLGFSGREGTGRMIRGDDTDLLSEFNRYVKLWRHQFVFHYPEADLGMLAVMGVDIPTRRVDDTMTRAYNLGSMNRIGLKVLAYRLCGMEMEEFEDVVAPYSHTEALDYLYRLSHEEWPKPEEWPPRAWSLNTYVKRTLGDLMKCEDPTKIRQILLGRWEKWPDEIVLPAIQKYGDLPKPSIAQVPIDKVIRYQCRDADSTLRVRNVLAKLATKLRRRVRAA